MSSFNLNNSNNPLLRKNNNQILGRFQFPGQIVNPDVLQTTGVIPNRRSDGFNADDLNSKLQSGEITFCHSRVWRDHAVPLHAVFSSLDSCS